MRNLLRLLSLGLVTLALAAAASLAGKWNIKWDTPGGERTSTATFTVDGDNVTVELPGVKGKITGTVKDDEFKVAGPLYSEEAGQEGKFRMEGKIEGNVAKGRGWWNEFEMTFTATRSE